MGDWPTVVSVSALVGGAAGLLGGILKDLLVHGVKRRIDRRGEQADALADLNGALGHIEDVWQSTGGRPTGHQADERTRRLEEYRTNLND